MYITRRQWLRRQRSGGSRFKARIVQEALSQKTHHKKKEADGEAKDVGHEFKSGTTKK
jgi:hypothetical protein